MATSSIKKNFVVEGKEQVEMFANAIEKSENNHPARLSVNARQLKTTDELRELMRKRAEQKR